MLCSILLIFASCILVGASSDARQWSNLAGRKEFGLNMHELRTHKVNAEHAHEDPFVHTKELMAALHEGLQSFTVEVSVIDTPTASMTHDEIIQLKEYNITTEYHLHDDVNYHSLDAPHTTSMMAEVTDDHLVHCGADRKMLKTGDLIVGTSHATWRQQRSFSVKTKYRTGLVYTRRVVSQTAYEVNVDGNPQTCVKAVTEEIHPFELFDRFRMQTVTHVPFTHDKFDLNDKTTYQDAPEEAHSEAYKLVHGISTEALPVDSPAQTCLAVRNNYFGGTGGTFHDGSNDDFSMILGYTVGCVSANMRFPCCSAFTFNYNQNTKAATYSLNLAVGGITGLTCTNCFVYTGAYLMVVVDYYYSWGSYMAMEAKISGALGFNVAAQLTNPAFSGSYAKTLFSATPQSIYYLPIGFGMSIGTSFGGLVSVLSGSGSATGSATFGTGASASAYMGVGYHYLSSDSGWTAPSDVSYNVIYPYATYSSFQLNNVNINIELVATQDFFVGYSYAGFNYITADFSVALTGYANYASSKSNSASPTMTLSATTSTASGRRVQSTDTDVLELIPGDVVTISVQYSDFNPGERTELFVSAHRDDDSSSTGNSILQVPFTVNGAGSDSFEVEWVVPWDTGFLQTTSTAALLHSLSVHASNQMSVRFFAPQKLRVSADPLEHGLVNAPAAGEIVAVNASYVVIWNSDGLTTFKRSVRGSSGLGALELVPFVNIELHYEDLDATGATTLATHVRLNDAPLKNDRSALVTFPPQVLENITPGCTRRFFVVVASTKVSNLMGWSKGYFQLVLPGSPETTTEVARGRIAQVTETKHALVTAVLPRGLHKASPQFRRPAGAPKVLAERMVRAVPLSTAVTPMGSCSSNAQVTYGSSVEGAFESVTFVGIVFSMSGLSAEYSLLQSSYCVAKPYVQTGEPPSDTSGSKHGLSTAWVAGISVISTVVVLLLSVWLYLRYYTRGSVDTKLTPSPDLELNSSTTATVSATMTVTGNPLAEAAAEV